ncbi:MAG: hypothetical protein ACLSVD_11335 [Eggerthellaceae bacterium]
MALRFRQAGRAQGAGKSRSATAQQLLAQKVTFATMLHAFGVEDA